MTIRISSSLALIAIASMATAAWPQGRPAVSVCDTEPKAAAMLLKKSFSFVDQNFS